MPIASSQSSLLPKNNKSSTCKRQITIFPFAFLYNTLVWRVMVKSIVASYRIRFTCLVYWNSTIRYQYSQPTRRTAGRRSQIFARRSETCSAGQIIARKKYHSIQKLCFILSLVGFELFPPGKNNLVVARFDVDKSLIKAHDRILNNYFATNEKVMQGDCFQPHITLGKIQGKSLEVLQISIISVNILVVIL